MSVEIEEPTTESSAALLGSILVDLQRLVVQQVQLTRTEIEADLRQRAAAAVLFALGIGVFFLDAIMVCLSVSHLLHWVSSSVSDPAGLPLWACHAVIAAVLFPVGSFLLITGRTRFHSVITTDSNPITEILQEPVPWTTPPK